MSQTRSKLKINQYPETINDINVTNKMPHTISKLKTKQYPQTINNLKFNPSFVTAPDLSPFPGFVTNNNENKSGNLRGKGEGATSPANLRGKGEGGRDKRSLF